MPLKGKTVVITRSSTGNQAWLPSLQSLGVQVYALPTIETVPLPLSLQDEDVLRRLPDFDWLILTSSTSVRYLHDTLERIGLAYPKAVAAIGAETARAADRVGLQVSFHPSKPTSISLGSELPDSTGKRIVLPQSAIASPELAQLLRTRGGLLSTMALYDTRPVTMVDETFADLLEAGSVDFVVFASPSAVRGCIVRIPQECLPRMLELPVVAIGPETAQAAMVSGFTHVHTSDEPSIRGIVEILGRLSS